MLAIYNCPEFSVSGVVLGQRCWMLVQWTMNDSRIGRLWQDVVVVRQAA